MLFAGKKHLSVRIASAVAIFQSSAVSGSGLGRLLDFGEACVGDWAHLSASPPPPPPPSLAFPGTARLSSCARLAWKCRCFPPKTVRVGAPPPLRLRAGAQRGREQGRKVETEVFLQPSISALPCRAPAGSPEEKSFREVPLPEPSTWLCCEASWRFAACPERRRLPESASARDRGPGDGQSSSGRARRPSPVQSAKASLRQSMTEQSRRYRCLIPVRKAPNSSHAVRVTVVPNSQRCLNLFAPVPSVLA